MSRVITAYDSLITAPTALPFDVDWAKAHIRGIGGSEDFLIESWIKAASAYFERITGRQIMRAEWEYTLDTFPTANKIELPHPPLREVLSVKYVNDAGDAVSFSDGLSPETVSWSAVAPQGDYARRGFVVANYGLTWPTPRVEAGAVRVRYTAGYADTVEEVPDLVKGALALLVGHFEQFRSEVHYSEGSSKLEQLPFGVQQILREFMFSALPSVLHEYPASYVVP